MTKNSLKIFIATSMLISSTALADLPDVIPVLDELKLGVPVWKEENEPKIDVDNSGDTTASGKKGSVAVTKDYNTDGTLENESMNTYSESTGVSRSESYQSDSGVMTTNVEVGDYSHSRSVNDGVISSQGQGEYNSEVLSRSSSGSVNDGVISLQGTEEYNNKEYDTTSSITKTGNQEADIKVYYNGQEKDGWIKSKTDTKVSKTIETSGGRSRTIPHKK